MRDICVAMMLAIWATTAFCGMATLIHLVSIVVAIRRCRPRQSVPAGPDPLPPVTIIRPVCGIDSFDQETLRSSFELDYPEYEIIFCVADGRDPIVPVVRKLIDGHPAVRARLLVGDERSSINPKLNNCIKGWAAAAHDWIVLADSNVLMPRKYLQYLLSTWRPDTGLVCSPPIGTHPRGFWAQVECAFLNTYQARWQYFADSLGIGFAQGKTMLWRRDVLERAGGIRALGAELAEDAASTKVVRAAGLNVHLVDAPFAQPLGRRNALNVWQRQARWSRLRRSCFPGFFAPELISGALFPFAAVAFVADRVGYSAIAGVTALATLWYGAEMVLAHMARWPVSPLYPLCALARDLLLPLLWIDGWRGRDFVWRGNQMSTVSENQAAS